MSVLSPVTLVPDIRARTTQNCLSSTRNPSVLGAIRALVITRKWSSESRIFVSYPGALRSLLDPIAPTIRDTMYFEGHFSEDVHEINCEELDQSVGELARRSGHGQPS